MRVRCLATLAATLLAGSVATADCGKIPLVQVNITIDFNAFFKAFNQGGHFVAPQPPMPNPPPLPPDPQAAADEPPDVVPVPPDAPPPPPACEADDLKSDIGDGAGDLGLFEEPKQLGLIAWTGKKQLLAIRTDEMSVTKGGFMSILPLGGKPTGFGVKAGKNTMWNKAENVFIEAFKTAGVVKTGAADLGLVLEKKIGAHEIFVWKIDSFADFVEKIQHHINVRYKGKVVPLIPKDLKRIMETYVKNGYEYFAFDLVPETGEKVTKQTILYQFETPKNELFYPLVISQSGGKGMTEVDLLIVSDKETLTFGDDTVKTMISGQFKNKYEKYAKAKLTHEQVASIDPDLKNMFKADDHLYARWYTTKAKTDIRSFKADFRLKVK